MKPLLIVLLFSSLVFSACSSDSPPLDRVEQSVDGGGGTISLANGAQLEIPAGALSATTLISAEEVTDLEAAGYLITPDEFDRSVGASLALLPHGTTFAVPVTVRVPFRGAAEDLVVLRLANDSATEWEPIGPVTFEDGFARFEVTSFSVYTVAQVSAGGCPCYNGADLAHLQAQLTAASRPVWSSANSSVRPSLSFCTSYPSDRRCPASTRWYASVSHSSSDLSISAHVNHPGGSRRGDCQLNVRSANAGDFANYFPTKTPTGSYMGHVQFSASNLPPAQTLSCAALVQRASMGPALQLGFYAAGLPSGETLTLSVDGGAPTVVDQDATLTYGFSAVLANQPYVVTIESQPTSATCTVSATSAAGLTGSISQNEVIEFDCDPAPQIDTDFCNALDMQACAGVTTQSCRIDLATERSAAGATCQSEFDAVLACVTPLVNSVTTPSAGCRAPNTWELAFPSPCQTELDALEACQNPVIEEIGCNRIDDDNDTIVDEDPLTNVRLDTDSDGIPDHCDDSPSVACAPIDLAKIEEFLALPSTTCLVRSTTGPTNAPATGVFSEFSGFFVDYPDVDASYDYAWVATVPVDGPGYGLGCGDIDGTPTTYCATNTRPARVTGDTSLTMAQYDACTELFAYVCQ